jgi:hydroxybutyrate-dimer hydrolase
LTTGTALPPSQVVRTTPRCGPPYPCVAAPIMPANVPDIAANPVAGDQIVYDRKTKTLYVPD